MFVISYCIQLNPLENKDLNVCKQDSEANLAPKRRVITADYKMR
jgi:hypothetical protein